MNKYAKMTMYYAIFIVLLCIAVFYSNRSFFFAVSFSVLAVSYAFLFKRRSIGALILILVAMAGLLTALIFLYESDSSLGRILIYKISWNMFEEHYLTGIGSFKSHYLEYQAQYFCNEAFSTKEMLLADNTFFAFNEYWKLVVSYGIGAIFVLLTFAFLFWHVVKRCWIRYQHKAPLLLLLSITSCFAILIAACFTHVFDALFYRCTLLSSFIILCYYAFAIKKDIWVYFLVFGLFIIMITIGWTKHFEIFHHQANMQWKEAKKLWRARYISESIDKLSSLYPEMKHNVNYLGFYADGLLSLDKAVQAEPLLKRAIQIRPTNLIYESLGDCYSLQNKLQKAEQAYKKSICMVPNRFGTRYSLFKFYLKTRQKEKAIDIADEISKLPVKVPSERVDYIKEQVQSKIHHL